MSKYYKEEDIIKAIESADTFTMWQEQFAINTLKSLPTIEIVNCIECAYRGDDWWCYKHEFTPIPIEDYFCKDGEWKE